MAHGTLVSSVVEKMLDDVIGGVWPPGSNLPSEAELSHHFEVSRMTIREAVRVLQTQGVFSASPGHTHVVNPLERWTGIEPIMRAIAHEGDPEEGPLQLIGLRFILETGAASLAAPRRTEGHLERMRESMSRMREASRLGDVPTVVSADLDFHTTIYEASGNRLLRPLMDPLTKLMREQRRQTSSIPLVQRHAIIHHGAILEAITERDSEQARQAMADHISQTEDDYIRYVLKKVRVLADEG
ncbi:MAG: FadR family transcriptional regulator [Propionibacteriaceae bacterium]|jgi:DNA-binding FadR family transcriptional regulator|nr:FadR family transcriptional regulator [Propionibacteriaceae bacterium]